MKLIFKNDMWVELSSSHSTPGCFPFSGELKIMSILHFLFFFSTYYNEYYTYTMLIYNFQLEIY